MFSSKNHLFLASTFHNSWSFVRLATPRVMA